MRKSIIPPPPGSATFSPDGSTSEVEHLAFDLPGISILEVAIDPARPNKQAIVTPASIKVR
jgi:hypothetical protein